MGSPKPAIYRLARRGSVNLSMALSMRKLMGFFGSFCIMIRDVLTYTKHTHQKPVTAMQVVFIYIVLVIGTEDFEAFMAIHISRSRAIRIHIKQVEKNGLARKTSINRF